ncbi:MAG: hypothetical protein KAT43_05230 [Nanoarchaeota archaeon]|nr:hypothetical protein [Nanoarchaeota archaeon]
MDEKDTFSSGLGIILGAIGAIAIVKLLTEVKCCYCGNSNSSSDMFCKYCGARLK